MARWIAACLALGMLVPAAADAFTQLVVVTGIAFDPRVVEILPGDSVRWENQTEVIHTVTDRTCLSDGACAFDEELSGGEVFTKTFTASGVFLYQCRIHGFSAQVKVADPPGAEPDLAVTSVRAQPATIAGAPLFTTTRIETEVANEGTASSPSVELRVEYRYRNRWWAIGSAMVAPLSPGASTVVNVLWDTSHAIGDFTVRAVVDPDDLVAELRPNNNIGTTTASLVTPPGAAHGLDLLAPMG